MNRRYGKVYNLGHRLTQGILDVPLYAQEKVDGSQFTFGVIDGELFCRSKRANIDLEDPQKLFKGAVETAVRLFEAGALTGGWTYRGEAIERQRHNVLTYDRAPKGNIVLFDIDVAEEDYVNPDFIEQVATSLGLEATPVLFNGTVTEEALEGILDTESFLGGPKIEGVVLKPLHGQDAMYGPDGKRVVAKVVSAAFREVHRKHWGRTNVPKGGGVIDGIADAYGTEARWLKAIQAKAEDGSLENSPRDIGDLIKRIHADVLEEEGEALRELLWKYHVKAIRSALIRGFPQWYKDRLAREAFDG